MVELSAEVEVAKAALDPACERLAKSRRRWARTKSPADFAAMTLIEDLRREGNDRVKRLWAGPSSEIDSVMFELLVAAGCKERGRSIEFIREGSKKSADVRAHDPFPILIECKRKAGITTYELTEESVVREIFLKLRAACSVL